MDKLKIRLVYLRADNFDGGLTKNFETSVNIMRITDSYEHTGRY